MAKKTKVSRKADSGDENDEDSDRYDVINRDSTLTDDTDRDTSTAFTEENSMAISSGRFSEYSTDYGSIAESSLADTESDLSSFLLQGDAKAILESPDLASALTCESKPSLVGGWFDVACGWLDRPNMCIGSGGHHSSLLKQSHSRAAKAMNRLKINETLKKGAETPQKSDAFRKTRQDHEKRAQDDLGKGATAAMNILTTEVIQPLHGPSDVDVVTDTRGEPPVDNSGDPIPEAISPSGSNVAVKGVLHNADKPSRDGIMAAKMEEVSARAAEILQKTLDSTLRDKTELSTSHTEKLNTQRDSAPKKATEVSDHEAEILTAPIELTPKDSVEVSDRASEVVKAELDQKQTKTADEGKMPAVLSHNELRKQVFDAILSKKAARQVDRNLSFTDTIEGHIEDTRQPDPTPLPSEDGDRDTAGILVVSHDTIATLHGPHEDKSHDFSARNEWNTLFPSLSITDLTHVTDGIVENEPKVKNLDERRCDSGEPEGQLSPHGKPPRHLVSTKHPIGAKAQGTQKDVEVITLFELEDDDSWTPGEIQAQDHGISQRRPTLPEASARPDPSDSTKPSRTFFEDVRSLQEPRQEFHTNTGTLGNVPRHQSRASGVEGFNDPRAREAFLGLRRGRLETREKILDVHDHQTKHHSPADYRNSSHRRQSFEDPPPSNAHDGPTVRKTEPIIPYETGRTSLQAPDRGLELRRRAMGAANEISLTLDASDRRAHQLTSIRSIDEAQRLRSERSRDLYESDLILSRHRAEKSEQKQVQGYRFPPNQESPINVHQYMSAQSREQEELASRKSFHQKYERTYLEGRPSRDTDRTGRAGSTGRDQGLYNSVIINRSKSRDGGAWVHDVRDDTDTPYTSGRRDPSGHSRYEHPATNRAGKNGIHNQDEGSNRTQELMTLERQNQLKEEEKSKHQGGDPWNAAKPISVTDFRQLEKRLEEKRTAKLQRLRTRKISSRHSTSESIDDVVHYDQYGDASSHYNPLKALRESTELSRQMSRRPNAY